MLSTHAPTKLVSLQEIFGEHLEPNLFVRLPVRQSEYKPSAPKDHFGFTKEAIQRELMRLEGWDRLPS